MATMIAARLHAFGEAMRLENVPIPEPRPGDVLVAVKACGMVPNLANIITHWPTTVPYAKHPALPAIFGLDPAGVVEKVGSQVHGLRPGDRVYVNPGRGCGSCRFCRNGRGIDCASYVLTGYFGRGPLAEKTFEAYPYGGFAQYLTAPATALAKLPDNVSFEAATRFGYLGTAYSALKRAGLEAGQSLLINGISGTLGVGAVLLALAMGGGKILGTGRNQALLDRVKALAPGRIEVLSVPDSKPLGEADWQPPKIDSFAVTGNGGVSDWALSLTGGEGVDVVLDALPFGSPASAMMGALHALHRGGKFVNAGGMWQILPLPAMRLMASNVSFIGSCWFTTEEADEMARMAASGALRLDAYEHHRFPLARINEAISGLGDRQGGFSNFVIIP